MKIAICSDLHLEFGDIKLENKDNADVLVLSGDIFVASHLTPERNFRFSDVSKYERIIDFLKNVSTEFKEVILIMGNHEHYDGDFAETANLIRKVTSNHSNIHFMDKEVWEHNDYVFVGGTLWTDFAGHNEDYMSMIINMMNDYRGVLNSSRMVEYNGFVPNPDGGPAIKTKMKRPGLFTPQDAFDDHKAMLDVISQTCIDNPNKKIIVCSHHGPSGLSTHPRYKNQKMMNSAYNSNLDSFILDHPQIKLWTHGHTHDVYDYMIGSTRIVCNPRGYVEYEQRADEFELLTIEV